jgi:peptide/nickel transport system permease protein
MGDVANLIVRRLLSAIFVLWVVVTFIFFFMRLAGDPVTAVAGESATQEQIDAALARYGFDRPILVQYFDYLGGIFQGDFGESLRYTGQPAMALVLERLPATLALGGLAFLLGLVIAIPLGIISALRPGSVVDSATRVLAVLGQSMPVFWLGILLILLFSVNLHLLPSGGSGSFINLILPSVTLAVYSIPLSLRLVRSAMLEVLNQEYVTTARAKGVRESVVIIRHALRNALIPVITVLALSLGHLITGAVVLEQIFSYPGLGRLAIASMQQMDFFVVQAFVLVVAGIIVLVNLLVDVLYGLVDPRIRVG